MGIDLTVEDPADFEISLDYQRKPKILAFRPEQTGTYEMSTCYNGTTIQTAFEVWDSDTLSTIAAADSEGGDCALLPSLRMQADKLYFVFLRNSRPLFPIRGATERLEFRSFLVEPEE